MERNIEQYKNICLEYELPIFFTVEWLNSTAGYEGWDYLTFYKKNRLIAVCTFSYKNKIIFTPKLTPYLGPFFIESNISKVSDKRDAINYFIKSFPKFINFKLKMFPNQNYWIPFHWGEFKQSSFITYIYEGCNENFLKEIDYSKRKQINKSLKNEKLTNEISIKIFYKLLVNQFGHNLSYSYELLESIITTAYDGGYGKIYGIINSDNIIVAANFVVWDNKYVYNLISYIDPLRNNTGASARVIYEIINDLKLLNLKFNFEGSMINGVEKSFSLFSTKEYYYNIITKKNTKEWLLSKFLEKIKMKKNI